MEIFNIINPQVKQNCLRAIQELPLNKYQVQIKEKKRSLNANNLYWVWLTVIGNVLGYTKDELHEEFASRFLGVFEKKTISGNTLIRPISTTTLNKSEFSDYMNKIHAFALSQEITLPQPDYYGMEEL